MHPCTDTAFRMPCPPPASPPPPARVEHHLRQAGQVRRERRPDRAVAVRHRRPGHPVLCGPGHLLRGEGEARRCFATLLRTCLCWRDSLHALREAGWARWCVCTWAKRGRSHRCCSLPCLHAGASKPLHWLAPPLLHFDWNTKCSLRNAAELQTSFPSTVDSWHAQPSSY